MTRFPAFLRSQRWLRIFTAAVAAASAPTLASAQAKVKRETVEEKNAPVTVSAERISGRPDREVILERDVEITRGQMTLNADHAVYNIVEDEVEANGNVRMRRYGDTYTGDEARLRIETGQGYVLNPTYHLELNNGQGRADRINFEARDRAVVVDGSYSTCEGPDPDWYLKSSKLTLDTGRDVGNSAKTVLYFKGVPILAAPSMSFPLSEGRKSGFLPPTVGTTNKGGVEVTVPYYVNIAPNRDLTLYPKVFARRGLQLGAEGRYLSPTYAGETRAEFLPDDRITHTNRYALTSTHAQTLTPALHYSWNINLASDNNYPSDFSRTITASAQRLLPRDLNMNYVSPYWNASARVSNYQVLQDPLSPITAPYDRLPQLTFAAGRPNVGGFDWVLDSELSRFWHTDMVRGDRFVINPHVSYPILRPGYFVTPRLSLHATQYQLQNQAPGTPQNLTRVLPTFSVDSGLVFQRDTQFFGQNVMQTLEPRLFYLRTPFRDQSLYPVFDTAEPNLTFLQLFSENRFIGNDRIGDANQITVAMVSRYIEPSGAERMRLAIGQRYSFIQPLVTLNTTTPESRSDVLLSAAGRLSHAVSVEANLQYSESQHTTPRSNYGVRWQPAPKSVLNVQYRRDTSNNLKQIDTSAQWPFASRWYGVGRINYSLQDKKVAEGLFGVEYKADCWIFRIVAQRIPTATSQVTSALYFQLELNGLTRLGSNPLEALRASIPGYQLVNTPSTPP